MRYYLLSSIIISFLISSSTSDAHAQFRKKQNTEDKVAQEWLNSDTLLKPVPINRQIFTDNIVRIIRRLDGKDGFEDGIIEVSDPEKSAQLTKIILGDIPKLDILIENLPSASHQDKIGYHRALENMLKQFFHRGFVNTEANYFANMTSNFRNMLIAIEEDKMNDFIKKEINIYSIDNSSLLDKFPKEKAFLFESYGSLYPKEMIKRLGEFYNEPFADKIVSKAAQVDPTTILIYATSTSVLSQTVRRNPDPLVQTIVRIGSESKNPNRALPFVNEVHRGKKTIAQVDALSRDEVQYFKALVNLKKDPINKDNSALNTEILYRGLGFVRVVNELHERPAHIRFASLMNHSAEEIYFMIVGGQDEIYTSSFTWMFDRLVEKMKPAKGNELLADLNNSNFRTFIRMCAGYGTLETFLNTMNSTEQTLVMKQFVSGLEKGAPHDLEDAVDVADAFGGLKNKEILEFLKKEVKENYERTYKLNNHESQKGVIVYGLLSTIFNHSENTGDLSDNLNSLIPPITSVPNSSLRNEKGEVIQQVFFYGDDDGKMSYANFVPLFRNSTWKTEQNQYWIKFTSTGKNKVIIYANKPLTEPEDEVAQRKLKEYFIKNNIEPTVAVHRGHSYFLTSTIENLTPSAKVVVLGSCGGYHNLGAVLDAAPDAHIISSKQVGALSVNVPISTSINDYLLAGKDLDWVAMWSDLEKYFKRQGRAQNELFSDYIPPNKNLGAIFIKAYRKLETIE